MGAPFLYQGHPVALDIEDQLVVNPQRVETKTYRILRDTKLSRQLKQKYNFLCQVCRQPVQIGLDNYAEVHHVKPLGTPHNGPDIETNILVLCPNHHVQFDYGAIRLELSDLHFESGHSIDKEYIHHHNSETYIGRSGNR